MSAVTKILTTDQIHDLWGLGYTILPRSRHPDPFHVPPELVPQGRSYQWWHLVHDKIHFEMRGSNPSGWAAVPASRHDGYFMPFGISGPIEVNGLGLFEKAKVDVDQERAQQIADARKPMQDWAEFNKGFIGGARVVQFDEVGAAKVTSLNLGDPLIDVAECRDGKTIETTVAIPPDMLPHMSAIFAERDRLRDEIVRPDRSLKPGDIADEFYAAMDADKSLPLWPTLHAILLPIAIENVRKSLKQETAS